ncbi:MAG: hypothetical protein DME25_08570 [Verrucomicrobia bacterium]|nr:MAG: hypothetical protein DME25_08570 [Verrucomicrobiota bacterium]
MQSWPRWNEVEKPAALEQSGAMSERRVPLPSRSPDRSRTSKRALRAFLLALVLVAALQITGKGCGKPAAPAPGPPPVPGMPTQAQPKLQTMKLWLGAEEIVAELALTQVQQNTGMMFRTNMAENAGMLFPLPYAMRASFWMKNCPLPLSIAYINPEGVIEEIHDLEPHNTNSVISLSTNIRFALETPRGWFERHQVHTGMVVRTEKGSLMETFFPK